MFLPKPAGKEHLRRLSKKSDKKVKLEKSNKGKVLKPHLCSLTSFNSLPYFSFNLRSFRLMVNNHFPSLPGNLSSPLLFYDHDESVSPFSLRLKRIRGQLKIGAVSTSPYIYFIGIVQGNTVAYLIRFTFQIC